MRSYWNDEIIYKMQKTMKVMLGFFKDSYWNLSLSPYFIISTYCSTSNSLKCIIHESQDGYVGRTWLLYKQISSALYCSGSMPRNSCCCSLLQTISYINLQHTSIQASCLAVYLHTIEKVNWTRDRESGFDLYFLSIYKIQKCFFTSLLL